ncbi:BMP family ABC transporter substrate-binding protein [Leptothermofonsia sichuanensis E412]|uniref:BMP family lipoprotein n=1 Tax=Leptothermofonsia sichuanensis TaxID=2917832 RepID=UPI001CA77EA0|nr:BMP family ABC transporter substrate-binding protein [Leptothermofonsia sichuanensis]QZZ19874.1 BMP family ABC transporter substrate-binding protein [Leptothermofonsia sichuanensis E412]
MSKSFNQSTASVHRPWLCFKRFWSIAALGAILSSCSSPPPTPSPSPQAQGSDFTVGMVIVGPRNDGGWNQAHYEGMQQVAEDLKIKFEYVDKVNPADRPNVTGIQVADDLIAKGAKMVIFNSDDFKDDALEAAKKHPEVFIIHASGDYSWKEGKNYKNQPNLINIMGRMEYGKMMAGCAAALGTETGRIGYLGPLINDETRRYTSAAYLGARYCWENYLKKKPEDLQFKVTWIGFWFNIPGKTLDPTKVADDYYNGGYDVVMSGIDTPEAAVQGKKAADAGKPVKYVHYDLKSGCDFAPDICLGVSYYNWALPYTDAVKKAMNGQKPDEFVWLGPNWKDINGPDSMIGFLPGKALGDRKKYMDEFIKGMGDGSINLYKGPLTLQDGTVYVKEGEVATDQQIWYLPQLLAGMEGPSK